MRGCPRLRNPLRREGCSLFYTEALLGFPSFTSGFKPGLSLPAAPLPSPARGIPRTVQREGAGPARRCGARTSPRPGRPRATAVGGYLPVPGDISFLPSSPAHREVSPPRLGPVDPVWSGERGGWRGREWKMQLKGHVQRLSVRQRDGASLAWGVRLSPAAAWESRGWGWLRVICNWVY